MKNRKLLIALSVLVTAGTLGAVAAPAYASDDPQDASWKVNSGPAQVSPGARTYTFPTTSSTKPGGPVSNVTVTGTSTLKDSTSKSIHPSGGSTANLTAGYSSSLVATADGANFKSGSSYAKWLGASPVNATNLTLEDRWSVSGAVASVSLPAGISFSGSGNERKWSTTVSKAWNTTHSWSNIDFKGVLFTATEDVSTAAQFGTQFFSTDTGN